MKKPTTSTNPENLVKTMKPIGTAKAVAWPAVAVLSALAALFLCGITFDIMIGTGAIAAHHNAETARQHQAETAQAIIFLGAAALPWVAALTAGLLVRYGPAERRALALRTATRWWFFTGAVALLVAPMGAL